MSASPIHRQEDDGLKRKRSPSPAPRERAQSPPVQRRRSLSPPAVPIPRVQDVDPARRRERERQLALQQAERELLANDPTASSSSSTALTTTMTGKGTGNDGFDAAAEFAKLTAGSRSGGTYIPPARLREMQMAASEDKASPEYQRLVWDALRKSLNGLINKVNVANIKHVVPELFGENLVRGRGLFARSIMKAQAASLPFTPVFAALIAIINTKLPQVGELVLTRLVSQFRRAFKRNDKTVCLSTASFIAHLVNQSVAHEIVALQILLLLLENPTSDSIEIACALTREVGAFLTEHSPKPNNLIFERFRAVLHEGNIEKRVQYMIEVLFQTRKDRYKDNPIMQEGLDLVEEDEQITHRVSLEDELKVEEGLNVFKLDPDFIANEDRYKQIKAEILGDEDSDDESGSGGSGSESDDDESDDEESAAVVPNKHGIQDMTETNMINLRRTIYLTIMNSLTYEEAVHKLLKVQIQEGMEIELVNMVIECCSQERSYSAFYGLIGERFCKLNRTWCEAFELAFSNYYETIHRYETNRLRNIGRFFGHLLASDGISWGVFHVVHMNEEETTSSSRIFIKILLQEMTEELGVKKIALRFGEPSMQGAYTNVFPIDNPKNTRFSINYFTSIGLGAVTEKMREHLTNMPRLILEQRQKALEAESSDSDSSSSDSSSSDSDSDSDSSSSSDSDSDSDSRGSYSSRSRSRSPPRGASRRRRDSSTPPPRRRRRGSSVSSDASSVRAPVKRGGGGGKRVDSRSPSPPPLPPLSRRRDVDSRSPPPPPAARLTGGGGGDARARRDDTPPLRRRGYRDDSRSPPPPRRRRQSSTPPRAGGGGGGRGGRDDTPPRRYGGSGGGGNGRGRRYDSRDRSSSRSRSPPRGGRR